ncbi:unnamed protein product [Cuscuta epithymum]|uniref:Uncharacterized protein n=1 Tax=Cuscuta epithymum TaxID=186058 RepID=A0AAV0G639_9ASTE|nr:unnamed protein product [Cuscuta epithymum]CAH9143396.1 unnamed protein product [Cuscuta epithymum]
MAGKSQKIVTHPLNIESTKVRHSKLFSKFVWRSFLIFNLALGAFLFSRPVKREASNKGIKPTSKDTTISTEELFFFRPESEIVQEPLTKEHK